jgi:hypothetical protein
MAIFGECASERNILLGGFSLGPSYCPDQFVPIFTHLEVLSWPGIGVICFALGWLLLVYGAYLLYLLMAETTGKGGSKVSLRMTLWRTSEVLKSIRADDKTQKRQTG